MGSLEAKYFIDNSRFFLTWNLFESKGRYTYVLLFFNLPVKILKLFCQKKKR